MTSIFEVPHLGTHKNGVPVMEINMLVIIIKYMISLTTLNDSLSWGVFSVKYFRN